MRPNALLEKILALIDMHERTTGKRPDEIWLETADYKEFIWGFSGIKFHVSSAEEKPFLFQGLPVKEARVIRFGGV